ncbi:phosphotransferase [Trueperella abortisuis]|uniref:1,4-alpha-glucan branching enzyme n=1 Tax=Trueperella abortisuis TaxID=445930 RepID=A0ABT9PJP9_9ACTO|nr:phosphotransferase [Trueperella abortisuis]MDP9832945.1 1,4-alpha-glucan branching enzyme [Trueperella abortisuis]
MIGVIEDLTPEALAGATRAWMTAARWFTGDPDAPVEFGPSALLAKGQARTEIFLVRCGELTFSVPLTFRAQGGAIGVFDATDDADGQAALLGAVYAGQFAAQADDGAPAAASNTAGLRLEARPIRPAARVANAAKLTSEQSNTSIVYRFAEPEEAGSAGIILKVFRVLSDGANPDVELLSALDASGSRAVPRQYGSVRGTWGTPSGPAGTDMLVAQEFLVGATDAWQVIQGQLARTTSFTQKAEIEALGALTRDIHRQLAAAFPTVEATAAMRAQIVSQWRERAAAALTHAPALLPYHDQIEAVFSGALKVGWPALQRIHGDYHLGQVLRAPGRGWVALDFEGEPLRPLAERVQPDLALRDVAGILRSFDYAGGSAELAGGDRHELGRWTRRAQEAFMSGYGHIDGSERRLLDALILDKALYEVSYEAASRPAWLEIPVRGVLRLIAGQNG